MQNDAFKKLVYDLRGYENNLAELESYCKCGNRLLTHENLIKLGLLFHKSDDLRKVRQFAEIYRRHVFGGSAVRILLNLVMEKISNF